MTGQDQHDPPIVAFLKRRRSLLEAALERVRAQTDLVSVSINLSIHEQLRNIEDALGLEEKRPSVHGLEGRRDRTESGQ